MKEDIKKYFPSYNMEGLKVPDKVERSWLSIIRQLLKKRYQVISGDKTLIIEGNKVRTRIYTLIDL